MQALIAPFGSGKTFLFRQLKRQLKDKPIEFVHVKAFEDKWIRIGAILTAMITDLRPQANIRRDIETRSRQIINILGEVVVKEGKRVCLVIEDCHRLHLNTLTSLKLMREEDFAGHSPLFGVILIGWPEFLGKISNRKDILWRMQVQELNHDNGWFLLRERIQYLENVFGDAIEPATRRRIAQMKFTPEALNHYVAEMMKKAYLAGFDRIDDSVVQPSLKERYESLKQTADISYSMIADEAGVGKSTVALAIESEPATPATDKVKNAMTAIESRIADGGVRSEDELERKSA
nr:hypothetical protein 8 [Balneolaceae bacterium]